jgi:two-component system phosphate regulon sensor histidine kinase PhoR
VRRKTRIADGVLLALVAILTGLSVFAATRLYTTAEDRYIKEAFPIRFYARDALLQMLNEETGIRAYLITGDRTSLAPYQQSRTRVDANLNALARLTASRPEIAPRIATARRLERQLDAFYEQQIHLVEQGRAGQLRAQANVLAGKALFDRFRANSSGLFAQANAIVREAHASQRRTYWTTVAIALAAGIAAALVALWLLLSVPRRIWSLYDIERDLRAAAERGDRASRSLEHVDDAVVLLDPDGTVRYWNPGAAEYLGVPETEALDRPVTDVVPEFETIEELLDRDPRGAVAPVARDGATRWLVVRESDFPEGRVLVLQDVTTERELERARSDFLATASHELRTPLSAVYGAVRTLRRADRAPAADVDARLLSMIETESERLKEIVDQILLSADIDRDAVFLQTRTCDLRELCESTIAAAEARAPEDIELVLDAPEEVVVECDPSKLRQVVVNLVDNAVKYSPDGGRVVVAVRARPGLAAIEVTDQGIGIAPEAHDHIFEKFFRVDPEMRTGVGGTGLGLYISRELVQRMRGRLEVRSSPGVGSTFTVELPR